MVKTFLLQLSSISSIIIYLLFANSVYASEEIDVTGNSNDVYIEQTGSAQYFYIGIVGSYNSISVEQTNSALVNHSLTSTIIGDLNGLTVLQNGAGTKQAIIDITGDSNTASIAQKDAGNHYLDLDIVGDNHSATILQEGAGNKSATVELTNSGGAWNFNLTQTGSETTTYGTSNNPAVGACYTLSGCTLNIYQTN